jgi:hypothetical protein
MTPDPIRNLLGGYATGNLTPEQQRALAEAALQDQELFEALAREQPLRDLLDDPTARACLLAALDTPDRGWFGVRRRRLIPALVGLMAACAILAGVFVTRRAPRPVEIARVEPPKVAEAPAIPQQPAAPPAEARQQEKRRAVAPAEAAASNLKAGAPAVPAPVQPAPRADAVGIAAGANQAAASTAGAVSGRVAEPMLARAPALAKSAAAPDLRYTVLRQGADGTFSEGDAGTPLPAGEAVRLRFVSASGGELRVWEKRPGNILHLIASTRLQPGTPFEAPLPPPAEPGTVELIATLAPDAAAAAPPAATVSITLVYR